MTTKPEINHTEHVNELIQILEEPLKDLVTHIRTIALSIDPLIAEHIKWNSVSFFYNGEMKPFDPKTYQRDLLVCNTSRKKLLLVFPTGAKIKDELKGKNYPDGRKVIAIENMEDLTEKTPGIKQIIRDWLALVE